MPILFDPLSQIGCDTRPRITRDSASKEDMRVILLSLCKTRHQHQAEQDFHGILDPGSKVAMEILPCLPAAHLHLTYF